MSLARQYQQAHQERLSRLWAVPTKADKPKATGAVVRGVVVYPVPIGPVIPDYVLAREALGSQTAACIVTLRDAVDDDRQRRVTFSEIVNAVLAVTGVQRHDFFSPRRNRRVVHARHVAYYLCHTLTALSYVQIGRFCGKRDHTTVMHGVRKVRGNIRAYQFYIDAAIKIITDERA